jgi:hypothetical protein
MDAQELKVEFRDVIFHHRSGKKEQKKKVFSQYGCPGTELKGKSDTALTEGVQYHSVIRQPATTCMRYSTANL